MSNAISIFFAKREFLAARPQVYEQIASNFAEAGSRKISTLRDLFEAWAVREQGRGNSVSIVFRAISKRLESGMSFAESLKPFIPRDELLVIQAGESSGKLVQALDSVRGQKEMDSEIKTLARAAMMEPAMSLGTICMTAWFCGKSLWPDMLKVVNEKFWPAWSLPVIHFEVAFAKNWMYSFLVIIVIFLYSWSIPRWSGRIRALFDYMPPWSIYRDRQAANLLLVLGGLLRSGMELNAALTRVEQSSEPWVRWRIRQIKSRLAVSGANPVGAFKTGLFSDKILDLIEDAARNKGFDESLVDLGTRSFPAIIKQVKSMILLSGTLMSLITGMIFAYQVSVQQIATSEATNKYISSSSSRK